MSSASQGPSGKPRLFIAAFGAETNSFGALPTTLKDFEETCLVRPDETSWEPIANDGHTEFFELARLKGYEVCRGTLAYATPSGALTRHTYEVLRDEILAQLSACLPVDAVLLNLHGAMIADGYPDCEGDLLARTRALVGDDTIIAGLLDPHAHLSEAMIASASLLLAYKEYPHTDFALSARKLFGLVEQAVAGEIKPTMTAEDCRTIGCFPTRQGVMRDFVDRFLLHPADNRILDCSLIHSFPWGDVADAGVKVLVTTDNNMAVAKSYAQEVAAKFIAIREEATQKFDEAGAVLQAAARTPHPTVIADTSDNAGGGAPSDATFLLNMIHDRDYGPAILGIFWDPLIVDIAFAIGEGGHFDGRLGGKASCFSGLPADLSFEVLSLQEEAFQAFGAGDDKRKLSMGKCAALRAGNIDVVVSNLRTQVTSPECFTAFGLDPIRYPIIVVKSSNHFQAAFSALSNDIRFVTTPGTLNMDFRTIPYKHVDRGLWPLGG